MTDHPMAKSHQDNLTRNLPERSLFWLFAPPAPIRNYDVGYSFRQDSDFYYLTGQEFNPAIWAIIKSDDRVTRWLFYTPKPESEQRWIGKDVSAKDLKQHPLWDHVLPLEAFMGWLDKQLLTLHSLYLPFQHLPRFPKKLWALIKTVAAKHHRRGGMPPTLQDTYTLLAPLRQIKNPQEIAFIKRACDISAQAHQYVMQHARSGMTEADMAGLFDTSCHEQSVHRLAYPSIIAGGTHATVLHHMPTAYKPKKQDSVLMDGGCEWQYYASDITRVFPLDKSFGTQQRDIYSLVLSIQKKIISKVRPGVRHAHLQEQTIKLITEGLVDLKILKGDVGTLISNKAYEEYYYHSVSHFLGLDVHDTGPYRDPADQSVLLKPGMVLTIEPGLYFFKKGGKYLGIGVRIEDDVLVTESGHEVLSRNTPKETGEIEHLRN